MKENAPNSDIITQFSTLSTRWQAPSTRLVVLPRQPLPGWQAYFQQLQPTPVHIAARMASDQAASHIHHLLLAQLPSTLHHHPFTAAWVEDMADVCQHFAAFTQQKEVCFWLRSTRVCSKFHVDKTPCRLLLTYYGPGTEWTEHPLSSLPEHPATKPVNPWHIAILRGGPSGIVHRSPPLTESNYSLLMRLDLPSFLSR